MNSNATVRGSRGFTLIEVLMALSILALSVVLLLSIRSEAVATTRDTQLVRRLTMLAQWKMEEILTGVEKGESGSFRGEDLPAEFDRYRWHRRKDPVTVRGERSSGSGGGSSSGKNETVTAHRIELTVEGPRDLSIVVVGWQYEEEKRGEEEEDKDGTTTGGSKNSSSGGSSKSSSSSEEGGGDE